MDDRTCSALECSAEADDDWCTEHLVWHEWREDAHRPAGTHPSPFDRFWSRVDASGDCWLWTAGKAGRRYGSFTHRGRAHFQAHRWAYTYLVGPVADCLDLDHLCRNRLCVNPDHLQPVPHLQNVRRGAAGARARARTHCPLGHPYSGANLVVDRRGWRSCLICRRMFVRRYRERQQLAAA